MNVWIVLLLRVALCGIPLFINAIIGLDRLFGPTADVALCVRERYGWLKNDLAVRLCGQLAVLTLCLVPIVAFAAINEIYGGQSKDYDDSMSIWILSTTAISINILAIGWNLWRISRVIPITVPAQNDAW